MFATSTGSIASAERYVSSTQSSCMPKVAAVAATLLLVGTGTAYNVNTYKLWKHYVQPKVQIAFEDVNSNYSLHNAIELNDMTDVHELDVRNISQHLSNVREVLSPSMSELAKDLGITRQALYKWLSGENQPDDRSKVEYINTLSNIADEFSRARISDGKLLIKMKAFNGLSLLELVKNGDDWHRPVQMLVDESLAMSSAADSANFTSSKAKPSDGWKSSVSIPGIIED
ncbi:MULTISPECIES: helix-turn-helix transcriptional regulator [unclassified Enterobacter]|uniref:helix-turn-helix domain-containing protein n=1 Tax=unclassified Enterobacter TaxID=2608935 RepID=UPI0015C72600|nr:MULTISPECIES: helix-turn-helix transcriptional regulator [unclassified Enterobacter]MBB3307708.1 DNA-binding phage protein [Enterobacter sp. Sphag1F]NYI16520.1 DNA-binding phage protein [Enterobacter sp. Sphag71]